jgi:hypothetical protein
MIFGLVRFLIGAFFDAEATSRDWFDLLGERYMKKLVLAALAGSVFAFSQPAMAQRYQIVPLATNVQRSLATYTALLVDSEAGVVFNCSAQFDSNNQRFAREECDILPVEGKLPSGQIELRNSSLSYGWTPLWSVDQKTGAVTFCTALSAIRGFGKLWCVPIAIQK